MAPVTGSIAARQEYRAIPAACGCKGGWFPSIPVNGIGLVLEEVRACLLGKAVHSQEYGYESWFCKRNGIDSNPK
jgi:hypothetical protein